jgi:DNA polymerase
VGAPPTGAPAKAPAKAPGNLAAIRERLGDCQRCPLHAGRKQIVFGSGPPTARLMIIGDGPGAQEDAAGTLWQGEAGDLLDRMLAAMGLARDQVYLCSTVMCRLPDAEAPPAEALKACTPFLRSQLVTLRPEAVLVLGESAARFLTRSQAPIGALRGNWWQLVDWPAMSSHGLDQVLATPALKREVWGDLQQVMARLGLKRG